MELATKGRPWAKFVVPSSGSINPGQLARHRVIGGLLGQKIGLGKQGCQGFLEHFLHGQVGFGDEINATLVADRP